MIKLLVTIATIFFFQPLFAQNNAGRSADTVYNFNFENISPGNTLPDKWKKFNQAKGYTGETTTTEKHSGERSLLIERTGGDSSDTFGSIVNVIPAKYLGKEIEFKAYLKFQDVTNFVGILIRVDNAMQMVDFQSLAHEQIHGTKDWAKYSIKAKLPPGAQTIYVAAILGGPGKLWVDDAQLLIDGQDISQAKLNPDYREHPYGSNAAASGTVKLKTATLYYETYGSGEPLLLLHGDSQSIYAFTFQIGDLSKNIRLLPLIPADREKAPMKLPGP